MAYKSVKNGGKSSGAKGVIKTLSYEGCLMKWLKQRQKNQQKKGETHDTITTTNNSSN